MNNELLIKALRCCACAGGCKECPRNNRAGECWVGLAADAADALEAAEKRINELQKQVNEFIKNETHSSVINAMSRRIAELEAQLPKGERNE